MSFSRTFFCFLTLLLDIYSYPTGNKDIVEFTEDKKCGFWQEKQGWTKPETLFTPENNVVDYESAQLKLWQMLEKRS